MNFSRGRVITFNFRQNCHMVKKIMYIPEHRANTIRLDIFEFCFDYLGNQNPRPLAIGGIFAGYHWSGTNSKSDLKRQ